MYTVRYSSGPVLVKFMFELYGSIESMQVLNQQTVKYNLYISQTLTGHLTGKINNTNAGADKIRKKAFITLTVEKQSEE